MRTRRVCCPLGWRPKRAVVPLLKRARQLEGWPNPNTLTPAPTPTRALALTLTLTLTLARARALTLTLTPNS